MNYLSTIDELLVKCSELIGYNGKMSITTPEYVSFERKIKSFANKYGLLDTSQWKNIDQYLLKKESQRLTNDEMRSIINSLIGLRNESVAPLGTFDRIFISHSSEDIKYVDPFVKLMESIGLNQTNLFCSSIHGYGIPLCNNIYTYLKSEFTDKNILVVMFLSNNYYNSKPCLNEMGATWVMSKEYVTILIDEFKFSQIEGAVDAQKIGFKINDQNRLDEFKDKVIEGLKLKTPEKQDWVDAKNNFLKSISGL